MHNERFPVHNHGEWEYKYDHDPDCVEQEFEYLKKPITISYDFLDHNLPNKAKHQNALEPCEDIKSKYEGGWYHFVWANCVCDIGRVNLPIHNEKSKEAKETIGDFRLESEVIDHGVVENIYQRWIEG